MVMNCRMRFKRAENARYLRLGDSKLPKTEKLPKISGNLQISPGCIRIHLFDVGKGPFG